MKDNYDYLVLFWNIIICRRFKFVRIKSWGHVWPLPRGLNLYIVIYKEMLKKNLLKNCCTKWDNI